MAAAGAAASQNSAPAAGGMPSSSSATPRLMITKLVLQNFKSYGGVREIGPLHKRFSSVVGPNGSGKSNVIDALLFVFGKRAKKLRLNKVSELIHKSAEFPDLEFASVEVHFQDILDTGDGDMDYTVVPGSQLVVSRVAYMNNTSKYHVNGRASTFTDVTDLLRTRGIDIECSRWIILQGEVEAISLMKPKAQTPGEEGLLEFLEDIIGSNRYVQPIEEAAAKVEELSQTRLERLNRVRVVEKEKNNLESSKLEAESYMHKEQEVVMLKHTIAQVRRGEDSEQLATAQQRLAAKTQELEAAKAEIKTKGAEAAVIEGQFNTLKDRHSSLSQELSTTRAHMAACEKTDIKLQEDERHYQSLTKKLSTAVTREKSNATAAATKQQESEADESKFAAEIESATVAVQRAEAEVQAVLESVQDDTAALRRDLAKKQADVQAAAIEAAGAKTASDTAETKLKLAQSRLGDAEGLTKSLAALEADIKAKTADIARTQQELAAAQQLLPQANRELQAATAEESKQKAEILRCRTLLETAKVAQAAATGDSKLVAALMKAVKRGGALTGIGLHGSLRDLGSIPAKYEIALSAASSALSWLVTDSTEDAQACMDFLRQHQLGRAKFLVLDKLNIDASRMAAAFRAPEAGVERLFDLVSTTEDKFRSAFYFALRDTLVATDIDQAVRVAYADTRTISRTVTLDGQLIDDSGTMTGGAKPKPVQAAASRVGEAETKEAATALEANQAALDATRARIADLTRQIQQAQHVVSTANVTISKLTMAVESLTAERGLLQERIATAKAATAASSDIPILQREADQTRAAWEQRQAVVADKEKKVADVEAKIMAVGGPRLAKAKAAAESATNSLEAARRGLTKARVDAKNAVKAIQKATAAATKAEAELASTQAKIEALADERKKNEDAAFEVLQAQKAAETALTAVSAELKSVKTKFEALQSTVEKLRRQEVDLVHSVDESQRTVTELEKKVAKWAAYLRNLEEEFAGLVIPSRPAKAAPAAAAADGVVESKGDDGEEPEEAVPSAAVTPAIVLRTMEKAELDDLSMKTLERQLQVAEAERDELKGNVNMSAIAEYYRKEAEYNDRVAELDAVSEERDKCRKVFEALRTKRLEEFMAGFSVITRKLKEMYQMITLGGDAELELVERLDPFSEGIVFSVRPPNKSWKNISNLSGGEKTLSSLALIFALHHYKPTPLYVMDEIDAALDYKNVSIVGHYIKERTKNAQFLVISLRNNMFELADRLVGIYKTHDVTKSVTIDPKQFGRDVSNVSK